jgi:EmrB/QacA subfamily drug resistance transporter
LEIEVTEYSQTSTGAGGVLATDKRAKLALAFLAMAQFVVVLDASVLNVALPTIRTGLSLSSAELSWVVDGYLVSFGGLLLLGGRLGDILPRRAVFLAGLGVFTGASLLAALSVNGELLIAARVVQGAGGAVLAPAALAIVMTLFADGKDRARALGVWGGVSGAGSVAGVLLSGVLVQTLGWQSIFLINVPIGVVIAIGVSRAVSPIPAGKGRFDLPGAAAVTLAMAALAYGLVSGAELGWAALPTLLGLGVGVVALAAFVFVESRSKAPLVPLTVFRRPKLVSANALTVVVGAISVGFFFFLPQYQQQTLHMSPLATSLSQLPMALAITSGSLLAPAFAQRLGTTKALRTGLVLLTGGLGWLSRTDPDAQFLTGLLGPFLLIGVGLGLSFVYVTTLATAGASPQESGLVSGLANTSRQMGGALGLAALVAVSALGAATLPDGSSHTEVLTGGYQSAFFGATALAAAGLLLSFLPALRITKTLTQQGENS